MMKRRIVALLLAGLMTTAALASCRAQTNNNNNPGGTEPNQGTSQTTPKPEDPYTPPTVTWSDVDKTVYTVNDVKLRQDASDTSTALATIAKATAVHCTKQSSAWYYVEYDGKQGYIRKTSVTETNITGSDFVNVEGGSKIMYANSKTINVRPYPVQNDTIAAAVGSYSLNDEVVVLAQNDNWYKVKYIKNGEEFEYFVSKDCLSEQKVVDPDDDSIYENLFTEVNGEVGVEKYVRVSGTVNFRKAPNTKASIIMSLSDGVKVTVLKTGTVDGTAWSYIVVKVESDKEGVPSTYEYGYISSAYLADTNGDMTLDEFIAYHGFNKIEGGMMYYVLKEASIKLRSTPDFPDTDAGEKDNELTIIQSGTTPESIKSLKVVATGEVDGFAWFMAEYTKKEGDKETVIRCFVGGKALDNLTTDASGERVVTIQDLVNKYPKLTILETPEIKTATKKANCYGTNDTTGTVLGTIEVGTEVTVVATETGTFATWCVIQTQEGKLLFVGVEFFN